MTTYCKSYESRAAAGAAVERLLAAGVDGDDVRVLTGTPDHDGDRASGFAGSVKADAPLGTFAGLTSDRGMGGFAGSPATQHRGGFPTIDRETVTTFEGGGSGRIHDIGHRRLIRLLVDAGLAEDAAERDVQALHDGRSLVLVRGDEAAAALL